MNKSGKKKARLIREDIKDRHTSHWDLDYISHEELEQLMTRKPGQAATNSTSADNAAADDESDKEAPEPPAKD